MTEMEAENRKLYDENMLLKEQVKSLQEALTDALVDLDKARRTELGMSDLDFDSADYSHLGEEFL